MDESNSKVELEISLQKTRIIVLIEIFATVCLIIFGWFLARVSDNSVSSNAISFIWLTIILLFIASFVLRRLLFSWGHLQKYHEQKKLLAILQNNTVFLGLVGFIIAILGFLVATLSGNRFEILRAGCVAVVVFLINFPRKIVWHKIVENLEKVNK